MKRLILVILLILSCFSFAACGDGKDAGELCASDSDCASDRCGFGPCPDSGPACPKGEDACSCLVCL
ncbi:MAG: hypothetical protein ACWGSD_20745 [Thermodesulfobacteriota bacterium]